MTLTEKNEVIARFMGFEKDDSKFFDYDYEKDFGMLMPACQKFVSENWDNEEADKLVINVVDFTDDYLKGKATILDIHQALYEGIEWLNKQQNKEV